MSSVDQILTDDPDVARLVKSTGCSLCVLPTLSAGLTVKAFLKSREFDYLFVFFSSHIH